MKSILLTIALVIGALMSLQAQQNVAIGARGGLTIPNLTGGGGTPLSEGYSTRAALGFGVFAEFKVSNLFSIQPMLEYSQQGAKKNGMQAFPLTQEQEAEFQSYGQSVQYLYADFKSTAKLNYMMLPVLAKFGWDLGHQSHWRIYAAIGPYAGLLLNAHQVQTGGIQNVYYDRAGAQPVQVLADPDDPTSIVSLQADFDTTVNIKPDIHKFNFGIEGNVGIAYKFKRSSVFLEGGGNYGLLNIQKNAADGKNHSGAATIMIGYSLSLGK